MSESLLTIQQVMEQLQVADETIYRYINAGKLKARRVGGLWRVKPEDLEEFLESGKGRSKKDKETPDASA